MVRQRGERIAEWVAAAVLAATAYLVLLPWDLRGTPLDPGTDQAVAELAAGRVVALAAILVVLAGYLGWREQPLWASAAFVGAPPAALMLASFATHHAARWPLTWLTFALVLGLDAVIVALVVRNARNLADRLRRQV